MKRLLSLLLLLAVPGCERFEKPNWLGAPGDTIVYCHSDRCGKPTLWKQWRETKSCPLCGSICTHPPTLTPDGGKHANDHGHYVVHFDVWQEVSPVKCVGIQPIER